LGINHFLVWEWGGGGGEENVYDFGLIVERGCKLIHVYLDKILYSQQIITFSNRQSNVFTTNFD
jgi:hypothetical protein